MNALIDLSKCREYMTMNIGGRDHQVRLSGTMKIHIFAVVRRLKPTVLLNINF